MLVLNAPARKATENRFSVDREVANLGSCCIAKEIRASKVFAHAKQEYAIT